VHKPLCFIKAIPAYLRGTPLSFAIFENAGLQAWVDATCAKFKPDIAVAFSSNVGDYVLRIPASHRPKIMIADFADVDSEKWRNFRDSARPPKSWIYAAEAKRVAQREIAITNAANAVTFVTPQETALFMGLYPDLENKAFSIGNGVDLDYFDPALSFPKPAPDKPLATFTGTMDYWPNEQAAIWFVDNILGAVRDAGIDLQFAIVGARPTKAVQALENNPNVIVTGSVADVRPYLAQAEIVVTPMQIARGIQNKVLEGMAMGKPVIVSPGALTGIDALPGTHVVRAETPPEWIAACVDLLTHPQKRTDIGAHARARVIETYSWDAQLAGFDEIIAGGKAKHPKQKGRHLR
jgi:polysaccharide biosynthesis protein PslH